MDTRPFRSILLVTRDTKPFIDPRSPPRAVPDILFLGPEHRSLRSNPTWRLA